MVQKTRLPCNGRSLVTLTLRYTSLYLPYVSPISPGPTEEPHVARHSPHLPVIQVHVFLCRSYSNSLSYISREFKNKRFNSPPSPSNHRKTTIIANMVTKSAEFTKAIDQSKKLKTQPANDELLEVLQRSRFNGYVMIIR